jgi:hypothetical protein
MKRFIMVVTALTLATASVAGHDDGKKRKKKNPDKYCAQLKDGVIKVMHDGQELTADITLENGTQIRTDGTVVKKDGSVSVLKEGQCMDVNGQADDLLPPVKK